MALDIGNTGFDAVPDNQLFQVKRCLTAALATLKYQFIAPLQQVAQGQAIIVSGDPVQFS